MAHASHKLGAIHKLGNSYAGHPLNWGPFRASPELTGAHLMHSVRCNRTDIQIFANEWLNGCIREAHSGVSAFPLDSPKVLKP